MGQPIGVMVLRTPLQLPDKKQLDEHLLKIPPGTLGIKGRFPNPLVEKPGRTISKNLAENLVEKLLNIFQKYGRKTWIHLKCFINYARMQVVVNFFSR